LIGVRHRRDRIERDPAAVADLGRTAREGAAMTPEQELQEAWRAVANAKVVEYRKQCWRLAGLVRCGTIDRQAAVDQLAMIAVAHALVRSFGEDRIEAIIAEAFASADFHALRSEVARCPTPLDSSIKPNC
jgi:hypothetical protein